jgi:hypothetical protein
MAGKHRMRKISDVSIKIFVPVAIVLLFCVLWVSTLNTALANTEPKIITYVKNTSSTIREPVYIEVEKATRVLTTIQIERPIYVEKEVKVLQEVPVILTDWDNPEQLAGFLKKDNTDRVIILQAGSSGQVEFNGQCEDLALQLRDRAMTVGRYLSIQVLNPKEYEKWYGIRVGPDVYHAICMARIGNGFWYIEPSNDKYWLALNLD